MENIIGGPFDDIKGGKRLKCGEVFFWSYGKNTCDVECTLCEDRPSCSLTTFMEHLQIWHNKWETGEQTSETEQKKIEYFFTEDESKIEAEDDYEEFEPFEEVLIEIEEESHANSVNFLMEEIPHTNEECRESCTNDKIERAKISEDEKRSNYYVKPKIKEIAKINYENIEKKKFKVIRNQTKSITEFNCYKYKNLEELESEEIVSCDDTNEHEHNTITNDCNLISSNNESEVNDDDIINCNKNFDFNESGTTIKAKEKSENHCLNRNEENCLEETENVHKEYNEQNIIIEEKENNGIAINYKFTDQNDENYILIQNSLLDYELTKDINNFKPIQVNSDMLLNFKSIEVEQVNAINEQKCNMQLIKQDSTDLVVSSEDSCVTITTNSNEIQTNHTNEENYIEMQKNNLENEFFNSFSSSATLSEDSNVLLNLAEYNPIDIEIIQDIANSTVQTEDSDIVLNLKPNEFEEINNFLENDCDLVSENTQATRSDDSGFEKSDTNSLTASISTTASEDEAPFQPHSLNILEQIRFGLNEPIPKPKLTSADMEKVIELFKAHPRLWQQNHAEYNEPKLCRQSWEEITQAWNQNCQLDLSINDVRVRVSTLCQRYLKERQRREMELEGEQSKTNTKRKASGFNYFNQLRFLDMTLKSPYKKRTTHITQEHSKLLETFAQFPILWHTNYQYHGRSKLRLKAYTDISIALRLIDIHLSPISVRRRLTLLKKRYHIEKIRHLKCRLNRKTFEKRFKHYDEMRFLDKHIAPYVCDACGKIFQKLADYDKHKNSEECCGNINGFKVDKSITESNEDHEINTTNYTHNDCGNEFETIDVSKITLEGAEIFEYTSINKKQINENVIDSEESSVSADYTKNLINKEITKLEAFNESDNQNENDDNLKKIEASSKNFIANMEKRTDFSNLIREIKENNKKDNHDLSELNKSAKDFEAKTLNTNNENINIKENENARSSEYIRDDHIRSLITLFREYEQLWNTELPNFSSRRLKNLAWRALTTQFNSTFKTKYLWFQVQQRLNKYVRYYRRETRRIEAKGTCTSWPLYDSLKFLNKTFAASSELEKRIRMRTHTLKIIEIYKDQPQLWNTMHSEFTKRKQRHHSIALMCSRLQEVHNIPIEHDKLKQRLLDLRGNFRATKLAKIAAEKRNETFDPISQFEFYEDLNFLETHIAPFTCCTCTISFDRLSDYRTHQQKEHMHRTRRKKPFLANDIDKSALENVCHICGIEFTLRHNLIQHLNRHFAERTMACTMCGKRFFTSTSLQEHERIHTKIPAVICAECGQTFVNTSKLNQHMKRHRNQRDYPCDRCEKSFYTAFERDRHLQRHMNIRDKICPVCGKSFVMGSAYYTHIKLHNDKKQYSCKICNKEFAQHAGLYKHRKKYHPQD